jgi:chromosome segregation ATPase
MRKLLPLLTLVIVSPAFAQSTPENYLTESRRQEIEQRFANEAMEREAQRAEERMRKHRQEVEQQVAESRKRTDELREQEQKLREQMAKVAQENEALEAKRREAQEALAAVEEQARNREADTMRAKGDLDGTKAKLKASVAELEARRATAATRNEENQKQINKWNDEVIAVQTDIVRSDLTRLQFEKTLTNIESQTGELGKRLEQAHADRAALAKQVEELAAKSQEMQANREKIDRDLKTAIAEQGKYRKELDKEAAEFSQENKVYNRKLQELETARNAAEQEKAKYEGQKRKMEGLLAKARQMEAEAQLALAQSQSGASDAKIAMVHVRTKVISEFAAEAGLGEAAKNNAPAAAPQVTREGASAVTATAVTVAAADAKPWKLSKKCNIYEAADLASAKMEMLKKGSVVNAGPGEFGFVRVQNPAGAAGFVKETCGAYQP